MARGTIGFRKGATAARRCIALSIVVSLLSVPQLALAQQTQEIVNSGFVLGTVYEIDKERYKAYVAGLKRSKPDLDERLVNLDPKQYLDERSDVTVTARQLASNQRFSSPFTKSDGEYIIRHSPVGTFEFTLLYKGEEYAVKQRLDLNVELSYVAELCFVLDREEKVAWMVSDGARRSVDVPPWVPRICRSSLSGCLAMLTGDHEGFPRGLLLLLAGAGATAAGLGIISTDQVEASPPRPKR